MVSKLPIAVAIGTAFIFFAPLILYFVTGTSLSEVAAKISDPNVLDSLWTTLYPAVIASGFATLFGTAYAWILHRTNIPAKTVLGLLPFLGLTVPPEVRAIGFVFLFSPRIGLVNVLFMNAFNVNWPLFNIYSNGGLALAGATGGFPLAYIILSSSIRGMDSRLEDSSRITGSSLLTTLKKVTLPILAPAIAGAFILDFVIIASTFDYAEIFGAFSGSGIHTLATDIYDSIQIELPPDYSGAGALSIYYVLITVVSMFVYLYVTRKGFKFITVTGTAEKKTLYTLEGWKKVLALVICVSIIGFAIIMLLSIIIFVSFLGEYSWAGGLLSRLTLNNYNELFFANQFSLFRVAAVNSLLAAIVTGSVTAILATFLSYAALRSKVRGARILEYFNTLPIGTPGIVYGVALLWTFLSVPLVATLVYGKLWAVIIALVLVWLPYSVRIVAGSILQIGPEMDEAAYVTGARWFRMFRTVLLPLLRVGLSVSFVYVFLDTFRELGAITLLTTPQSYVLTTFIFDLFTQSSQQYNIIAATSTVMIISMIAFLLVAHYALGEQLLQSPQRD